MRRPSVWILGVAALVGCHGKKAALDLKEAPYEHLPAFSESAACASFTRPLNEAVLTAQRGGRLDKVLVRSGQEVHAGQILATVDETANAAGLKAKLSEYALAGKEYARTRGLVDAQSATREELDRAQGSLEVRRAELENAKQALEDAIVRAPIDGVVQALVFKAGDKVPDGGRIGVVVGRGGFKALCRFPLAIAERVPAAAEPEVRDDTANKPLGKLAATVERDVVADGFVGLDRELRFVFATMPAGFRVGGRVSFTVSLPEVPDVAKVPSLGVATRSDGDYVLKRSADGKPDWQKVTVLRRDPQFTYVTGVPAAAVLFLIELDLNTLEPLVRREDAASKAERKG